MTMEKRLLLAQKARTNCRISFSLKYNIASSSCIWK